MQRKTLLRVLFIIGAFTALTFASCSNEDPADVVNPYNIRFKTELKVESDNSYLIPAKGGTYTFDIYNGEPWLAMVKEWFDGKSTVYNTETGRSYKMEALWATADIEKQGPNSEKLTVKIEPSNKDKFRYVYVVVSNGMKSKVFVFKQLGICADKK
ncbi:MAG TPA: hypothetical protein DEQ17_06340 [Prevotella sp.]|nr:hypothetical protein [Prevotella sp.]